MCVKILTFQNNFGININLMDIVILVKCICTMDILLFEFHWNANKIKFFLGQHSLSCLKT